MNPNQTPMGEHATQLLALLFRGVHITATEMSPRMESHNIPSEIGKALAASVTHAIDKAENVVIARGMGWELDGVIEELGKALYGESRPLSFDDPRLVSAACAILLKNRERVTSFGPAMTDRDAMLLRLPIDLLGKLRDA